MSGTHLLRRACQDRFLSPRNLYFGAAQLYWECHEVSASESFPSGIPSLIGRRFPRALEPHTDGARLRKEQSLRADSDLDALALWSYVVSAYTMAKLTYLTDKLVALSGLTARMQEHMKCEYVAGMWRTHFAYQLLWTVSGILWTVDVKKHDICTAPSWSWASIEGHVENACNVWYADVRDIVMGILEVSIDLVSSSKPFG